MATKQTRLLYLLHNQGDAGLNEAGICWHNFQTNDAYDLARQLTYLQSANADKLNKLTENAHQRLLKKYSSSASLNDYRSMFEEVMAS